MNNAQKEGPKAEKIFELLSKKDAIILFTEAAKGIQAKLDSKDKLELSQKQYYVRLAQLVDLGLIEKREEIYFQTSFGRAVYNQHFLGMKKLIRDKLKYFEMEDVLVKSDKFSKEDVADFVSKLKKE